MSIIHHYNKLRNLINTNYSTSVVGLARSLFALNTLVNLLFNSDIVLNLKIKSLIPSDLEFYSIFQIFGDLDTSRFLSYSILIIVILGFFPRITAILHWWVSISFVWSSSMIEGGDQIAAIMTLLLIPILLLDSRKNHWYKLKNNQTQMNFYKSSICFFSIGILKIQVFVIYFFASIGKFNVQEWVDGTSVYYWLNDPVFGLNDTLYAHIEGLIANPIFINLITWGTLLLELFIASLILIENKFAKIVGFFSGLILHFLFALSFGLWSFFFTMSGTLLLYLYYNHNISDLNLNIFKNFNKSNQYDIQCKI